MWAVPLMTVPVSVVLATGAVVGRRPMANGAEASVR
jgi:hypothetical protein